MLQAGIVAAVEEILQRTAHIAEIFRCPEDNRAGGQDVLWLRFERASGKDPDTVAFKRVARRSGRCVAQAPRVVGRHMADDQKLFRAVFAAHEDGIRFVGQSVMVRPASVWCILYYSFELSVAAERWRQAHLLK